MKQKPPRILKVCFDKRKSMSQECSCTANTADSECPAPDSHLIPTLQILAEVMMNPTKTGSISRRFSRSTTGSSITSSFEIRGEAFA